MSGVRLPPERTAAGEKFSFLAWKTRARRDERDVRRRRRWACKNHLSVFGKGLHQVVVRESSRTVSRVRTGVGRSWGRHRLQRNRWVFAMGTVRCVVKSHVRHSYALDQASWCEFCVVRPCPQGQGGTVTTRMSSTRQESEQEPSSKWSGVVGGPSWCCRACHQVKSRGTSSSRACHGPTKKSLLASKRDASVRWRLVHVQDCEVLTERPRQTRDLGVPVPPRVLLQLRSPRYGVAMPAWSWRPRSGLDGRLEEL